MSTSALITMIIVQLMITLFAGSFLIKIIRKRNGGQQNKQETNHENL